MHSQGNVASDLFWVPPVLDVENIKPGEPQMHTFTLTNSNDVAVELSSVVTTSGELFEGGSPLQVSFTLSEDGRCADNIDAIPPQTSVTMTMIAELPITAGNEYQGESGAATFLVTATEAEVCAASSPVDVLPPTGAAIGGALVLAAACLAVGVALRLAARRRRLGER